jgi:hypothetical protein
LGTEVQDAEREEELLQLQRMEAKVVSGVVSHPGVITRARERQLRYGISLAALECFQPGAASGRGPQGTDVSVRSRRLRLWRKKVLAELREPLLLSRSGVDRIATAARVFAPLLDDLEKTRREVLERHANDFSARQLDDEIGRKALVSIAGGGGGAGYVYLGAWSALQDAGFVPRYVIGSSIGAVLGLLRARKKEIDFDEILALADRLRPLSGEILRFVSLRNRYGLPGLVRLYLHSAIGELFQSNDGRDMRLNDLEIPYEAVVAGVRRGAPFDSTESDARSHHLPLSKRPGRFQWRAQVAARLVQLVGFINPRAVKEIVLGSDELTANVNAVDAAGFSAAIPGILHYDIARNDTHMDGILSRLLEREGVSALVDGGVANNVPARSAWLGVQRGKIGTRNAYYLAFDCFYPQFGAGHVWLRPITQLISYQVALNARYAQRRVEMAPTLSPLNLLPSPEQARKAMAWGRAQMEAEIPFLQRFMERVPWTPQREPTRRPRTNTA